MHEASRTMRTLQNSKMAMLLFLVQIAVGFYSRRVFLHYLGTEVLGVIALLLCGLGIVSLSLLPYFFQHTECGLLYI